MDRIGKLTLNSRLLSGHLGFVAGTLRGCLSPSAMVRWVCNSRDPVLCDRVLFLHSVFRKNLNTTVLQVTGTLQLSSIQYSSSTNTLYLNILYTNSGCGKNIRTLPWTSGVIP